LESWISLNGRKRSLLVSRMAAKPQSARSILTPALALTTRCCDLISIPQFATAFPFIDAGVYHWLSPSRLASRETPEVASPETEFPL
jgi:hypothetical protein